jgi:hypothetical protein
VPPDVYLGMKVVRRLDSASLDGHAKFVR